jgi:hypothetical protein
MPSIINGNDNFNSSAAVGTRGQVFTSTGTFTVPAGVSAVKVTVVGGGGGGGRGLDSSSSGGGGGGAGFGFKWITGLTAGATVSVTVGAGGAQQTNGGTSSFGAYISATGGSAGGSSTVVSLGGAAGTVSGADIGYSGHPGFPSTQSSIGARGGVANSYSNQTKPLDPVAGFPRDDAGFNSQMIGILGGFGGRGGNPVFCSYPQFNPESATGYGNGGGGNYNNIAAPAGSGSGGIVIVEW